MGGLFAGIEYFTCWQQRAVNRVAQHTLDLLNVHLFICQLQSWVKALFYFRRGNICVSETVQSKMHLEGKVSRRRVKSFLKTGCKYGRRLEAEYLNFFLLCCTRGTVGRRCENNDGAYMEENELSISKVFSPQTARAEEDRWHPEP